MKDSTIITQADVYSEEIPSMSDSVMMSSEAPPPPLQASIPSIGFDVPDEVSSNKIRPATPIASIKPSSPETEDTEVIEEALPIVRTTLPMPEPQPKIEMNGFDMDVNDGAREKGGGREEELGLGIAKKDKSQTEDDSCLVNCIYFAQQCCECTIL